MEKGDLDPGWWYFNVLRVLRLARARQDSAVV
jgi:hypothetical protein